MRFTLPSPFLAAAMASCGEAAAVAVKKEVKKVKKEVTKVKKEVMKVKKEVTNVKKEVTKVKKDVEEDVKEEAAAGKPPLDFT